MISLRSALQRRRPRVPGLALARIAVVSVALCPRAAWSEDGLTPNVVIQWNRAALQGVRDSKLGPPMVARALAIVHTCIYDAWAAYDTRALGTQLGGSLRQHPFKHKRANQNKAISFAAYRATVDLFPVDKATVFDLLMANLGYDANDTSTDTTTPSGIGNVACAAALNFRHNDGSNQLGNLTASGVPYADYTGYVPLNPPSTVPVNPATVLDVNHWQPEHFVGREESQLVSHLQGCVTEVDAIEVGNDLVLGNDSSSSECSTCSYRLTVRKPRSANVLRFENHPRKYPHNKRRYRVYSPS